MGKLELLGAAANPIHDLTQVKKMLLNSGALLLKRTIKSDVIGRKRRIAAAAASAMAERDSIENTRRNIYQLIEKMSDLHNFLHQDMNEGIGYEYHMPLYKSLGDTIRLLKSYKNTYERILYSTGQPPFRRNLVTQPGFILEDGTLFPCDSNKIFGYMNLVTKNHIKYLLIYDIANINADKHS